jgi:hypothetical protein
MKEISDGMFNFCSVRRKRYDCNNTLSTGTELRPTSLVKHTFISTRHIIREVRMKSIDY